MGKDGSCEGGIKYFKIHSKNFLCLKGFFLISLYKVEI